MIIVTRVPFHRQFYTVMSYLAEWGTKPTWSSDEVQRTSSATRKLVGSWSWMWQRAGLSTDPYIILIVHSANHSQTKAHISIFMYRFPPFILESDWLRELSWRTYEFALERARTHGEFSRTQFQGFRFRTPSCWSLARGLKSCRPNSPAGLSPNHNADKRTRFALIWSTRLPWIFPIMIRNSRWRRTVRTRVCRIETRAPHRVAGY